MLDTHSSFALKRNLNKTLCAELWLLDGHFRRSAKASEALKEKQKIHQLPEHKLFQDVPTCWNSAYSMLKFFASRGGPFQQSSRTLDLTADQWVLAEETATILKPFIALVQEENVSMSVVLPILQMSKNGILE